MSGLKATKILHIGRQPPQRGKGDGGVCPVERTCFGTNFLKKSRLTLAGCILPCKVAH